MKIDDIRIGMKLRNPHAGRTGKVTKIEREGGLELVGNGLSWDEHVENVEPVGELHIGDYVRATGKSTTFEENVNGKVGIIDSFMNDASGDKCADIRWLCGSSNLVKVAQLTPLAHGEPIHIRQSIDGWQTAQDLYVHPVCESCEMASVITSQCKQIAELQRSVEAWTDTAARHCRNETYYRDQLYTLQKEALAECRPLMKVAKCYIQVEPERLLLSQDAKRVVELLDGSGPLESRQIAGRLDIMERDALDSLMEAREAGIVRLDDGKYSIVRD